ncbi:beta strand repeat-containing protein [Prosthecobacter sp.]|uniref:beta strand repeat-containing protein n=1 Tax=Prosthecobacter sp. TaxID=1965333 RepID=UPI003784D1FE
MPPAIRVNGSLVLWKYLGQGTTLHHYAGDLTDQRLTLDPSSGAVSIYGDDTSGLYRQKVIWTSAGGSDVRAVELDGSLQQNDQSPSWGPASVLVNQAVWRYVGTWDGTSNPFSSPPAIGDHYLGSNAGQRLVVDASGNATVFGGENPVTGTYAPQSEQEGAPKIFTVEGYTIYPGDSNGAYFKYQPSVGPPAVWVNGTTFAFSNSKENEAQPGVWVDAYADGNGNFVSVAASGVISIQADGTSNWSGYYVAADSELGDGGIFVVVNGSPRYDVRASNGVSILPAQGAPLSGHPSVVKVDGEAWSFGGSTPADATNAATDYYFGASAGKRLWIDATGAVSFTNTANATILAGMGKLVGSVFVMPSYDLRACTIGGMPVAPVGTPQWGPAALAVEGTVWNFIGTVADDSLPMHADYYAGMNAGQVISVNSDLQVAGAHPGVFHDGVFVTTDGSDLRALDSTGAQVPPVGTPANGYPLSLRIGGLHWNFMGSYDGKDYYAAALGGQRLSIDASGAVVYSDHVHNVSNATGTYADGSYTETSGGTSFNAGTIGNDLDILGNVVSFGSLQGNAQTAGVTLQFMDDGTIAMLQNALGRPQARWSWNRAATDGGSTALPVMQLDEQGRLNLYDPATAATPQVAPTISLAPGVQTGVQVSKLPKLELSNQALDTDNSVVTKTLGDERYLRNSGANQSLALTTGINVNTGSSGSTNTVPVNAAAIGQNLQASSGQVVVGRNNAAASNEVFVVGAGSSPEQTKNALSVSDSGDTTVAGNLVVTGDTTMADATVSGTLTVAGNAVLTQGTGTAAYLTSGELAGTYLKTADAAGLYLTPAAAAGQYLPIGADTVSIGTDSSVGAKSIGIGEGAKAGDYAVSLGSLAGNNGYLASGTFSISVGRQARSPGGKSIGIGMGTWAEGENSVAMGYGSTTRTLESIAIGEGTEANQIGQIVLGAFNELTVQKSERSADDSIFVIGNGTDFEARSNAFVIKRNGDVDVSGTLKVGGQTVLTQGSGTGAYLTSGQMDGVYLKTADAASQYLTSTAAAGQYLPVTATTVAIGGADTVVGTYGIGMGLGVHAAENAVSIGSFAGNNGGLENPSPFSGAGSVAIGMKALASGEKSITLGNWTFADGQSSIALGYNSVTRQHGGVAIGEGTESTQVGQVVIGAFNVRTDGSSTPADGDSLFILGNGTADNARSNAFVIKRNGDTAVSGTLTVGGSPVLTQSAAASTYATSSAVSSQFAALNTQLTTAYVNKSADSLAMGTNATAADMGFAIGYQSVAGDHAVSIGTWAGSNGDAASGPSSISLGSSAHGFGSNSISLGSYNWAAGENTVSIGAGSYASSVNSIAIGRSVTTDRWGQVVIGAFNVFTTNYTNTPQPTDQIFVVGNGTADDARSNAFVIKRNGDVDVSGELTINSQPAATQADVDQKMQTERTTSDAAYYRVSQPLVVPNETTLNGVLTAAQASRFKASFVVEGNTDPADNTQRTVIAKPGQEVLVPEQGDISMGEFRNGSLPISQ